MAVADNDIDIDEIDDLRFKATIKLRYSRKRDHFFAAVDGEKIVCASRGALKAAVQARLDARTPFVYQPAIKIGIELVSRHGDINENDPPIFEAKRCEVARSGQEWWGRDWGKTTHPQTIVGHDMVQKRPGDYEALPFKTHSYNRTTAYLPYSQETWDQLQDTAAAARAFACAQRAVLRGLAGLALEAAPEGLPELAGAALVLTRSLTPLLTSILPSEEGRERDEAE